MASVPLRLGLKQVGVANNGIGAKVILSQKSSSFKYRVGVAFINSRTWRLAEDRWPKPAPWPYKEKGYSNWHFWLEGTMKRFDENTKVITVEGPPAIGKSLFARALAKELEMVYFPMPTMDYIYINQYGFDQRLLDPKLPLHAQSMDEAKFSKDPKHVNAPALQFAMFRVKYSQYIDALAHLFNTGDGVVVERCIWTDMAFAEASTKANYMNKDELAAYHHMRTHVLTESEHGYLEDPMRPHLAIYLDASVDTVLKNLKKRGKGEEKTFHRDYLSALEETYKRRALVELEKHSEVLVYDWNEPGDVETVVEDIERIDFDRFGIRDEKMKDWRLRDEDDYCERRWQYTLAANKHDLIESCFPLKALDCPRLWMTGNDHEAFEEQFYFSPGNKWAPNFNPDQGDDVTMKFYKKIQFLPDNVTKMLLDRLPKA